MMLSMARSSVVVSVVGFLAFAGCGVQSATLIGGGSEADGGNGAGGGDEGGGSLSKLDSGVALGGGVSCATGYRCFPDKSSNVVWVMKTDGNVNGPSCQQVCESALGQSDTYHACDDGRPVAQRDMEAFKAIAGGLGFSCKKAECFSEAPGEGMVLVSIDTDPAGSKSCLFPTEAKYDCKTHPGNANCFGERYSTVCPCVPKPLDQACNWTCPPTNTTTAKWKTSGTSCLARINYWRQRACAEGWVECPPAGLPPMAECTACHQCTNSEAEFDSSNGAHASFTRCGESAQGEGGGQTCADVIDGFVSERKADANGVMRCEGHCGPILEPGCSSFSWGRDRDSGFHTLNWGGCNAEKCQSYCGQNAGACFTVETSPSMKCE